MARIKSILEYDLKPRSPQQIHDTYYDTKNGAMRNKQITLRLRKMNDILLLTVKSNPRIVSGRASRRREVELPWSLQSLVQVARYIKMNVPIVESSQFSRLTPSKIFEAMGLYALQERWTRRKTRDIIAHDKSRPLPFAELAIDEVTFLLERNSVRFFEIEIEAKVGRSLSRVRAVADALISKYQPGLQEWCHGKFLTGLAIQRLLETRTLQNYLVNGDLGPEAFQLIDRMIRSQRF